MTAPEFERPEPQRREPERRATDRRIELDRRFQDLPVPAERRQGAERRKSDRRAGIERRLALQSATAHMNAALGLLTRLADAQVLGDEHLRLLDAAMLRLRFAAERMTDGNG